MSKLPGAHIHARPRVLTQAPSTFLSVTPAVLVEGDQRVGVELGQCDVLGVEGTGPPEQDSGLPGDVLQDAVPEQPDPQPAHVLQLPLGALEFRRIGC